MDEKTTPTPPEMPAKSGRKANRTSFKPGYDPRRWMKGRGTKTPEQKEGEQILLAVLWDELSREFDTATMQPLEKPETIDALRLMVRTWIKKQPDKVVERIAGKITENVKIENKGQQKVVVEYVNQHSVTDATQSADEDQAGEAEA